MNTSKQKANEEIRSLFENMKTALDLTERVLQNTHSDGSNLRIAFNCKVYSRISRNDAVDLMKKHNMENQLHDIYTDDIVSEVYESILISRASAFDDLIQTSYDDKDTHGRVVTACIANWGKKGITSPTARYGTDNADLIKKLYGSVTLQEQLTVVHTYYEHSLEIYERTKFLDTDFIYQFGRSGGWMSIADGSLVLDYNQMLRQDLSDSFVVENNELFQTGKLRCGGYGTTEDAQSEVQEIKERCQAYLWIIDLGLRNVREITRKYLLAKLEGDIVSTFYRQIIEITPKQLQSWQEGKQVLRTNPKSFSYLRIRPGDPNIIETSDLSIIKRAEFIDLYARVRHNEVIKFDHAGSSITGFFEGGVLWIGCHKFHWSHIEQFAHQNQLTPG